jgi:chromate transporter
MRTGEVFFRFALISLLAFGGGSGTPLIERIAVRETGRINEREFTVAIALGQVTPGPVMAVATFIGYRALGLAGALAGTLGVFLFPWAAAAAMARHLDQLPRYKWLIGIRRGAAAAAVSLFGVTALTLARHSLDGWPHVAIAMAATVLTVRTKIRPVWTLLGGAVLGLAVGIRPGPAGAG